MSSANKMGKQSLGKGRDAHRQGVDLSVSVPRTRSQSRAARAQARDAVGRSQGVDPGSSGGSTRGSPTKPTDKTVAGVEGRELYRRHEPSSASDQEATSSMMIQNDVSPSSAASSPTPSLAPSDTALSMNMSSPRYVPHSHDGSVASRRTSTDMQHGGSGSPATTSQQTPRARTISSQKASKKTTGVRNFSAQKDSPPRPSARSLADFLPNKSRSRHGSSDGSTQSGQGSQSSRVGVLSSHPIPTPPPMSLPPKYLLDFPVRFMSYRDVAAVKSPEARPSSPPGKGGKGGNDTPPSPVVPPSPEGKGPAPGPVAASSSPTVSAPVAAVRALSELGRPPSESDVADLSMLFSRLGWSHEDRMRAVGFDPNASLVTTAAGPEGAIVPVVVHDGRTQRVKVEPEGVGGAAVAPPVAVTRRRYETDEMLARAIQAELNAADAAERAEQEAADEQYARSFGSNSSTDTPVYSDSDSDSGTPTRVAVRVDSVSSEAWPRPAVATTNRFACLLSPGRSRGRSSRAAKRNNSGLQEEASRSRAKVDRAAAEFAAAKTRLAQASPDLAALEATHRRLTKERRDLERQLQDIALQRGKARKEERKISQALAKQVRDQEEQERENKIAYDAIHGNTTDLLRRAVAEERQQKQLLDQAAATTAAATAETNAKRAQREAARVPAVRAADAAGKPILPTREWKPSQRHVEARAGLAREMAASAPSSVAASSAEAAAEAASSSAAAATAAVRVTSSLATTASTPAVALSAPPIASLPLRPLSVPGENTTTHTTKPAIKPAAEVASDDPVVARMRRQIELYKMVQASCPGMSHQDIQGMALACLGETSSAPPVGGGSSSSPTISMTPVGPAHPPQFSHPQHRTDGPGRGSTNFSRPEGNHQPRGPRDDRFHGQQYGQHHRGARGQGQGFKRYRR